MIVYCGWLHVVFVLSVFLIEWLYGLFVVIVCRGCYMWFCFGFCWTVVILCGRRKFMVGRCIATLLLSNPVSKRVRSDPCGLSFDLGVYCLLWKRFCVPNVALRMTQARIVWRTATDTFLRRTSSDLFSFVFIVCFSWRKRQVRNDLREKYFLVNNNKRWNAPWKKPDRVELYRKTKILDKNMFAGKRSRVVVYLFLKTVANDPAHILRKTIVIN